MCLCPFDACSAIRPQRLPSVGGAKICVESINNKPIKPIDIIGIEEYDRKRLEIQKDIYGDYKMRIDKKEILHTDILIIGGGTAGCYAAMTIREHSDYSVIIAEKANIKRSGCLTAGVNALNAYITKGHVPQDYVDYADKDADHIVRQDLLLSMSEGLNRVTAKMEQLGLVILKDENGEYVARGNRNIKINGENFKPLLADAVKRLSDVTVINQLNITDYIVEGNLQMSI